MDDKGVSGNIEDIEDLLETYTFEEVLEFNDLTELDVIKILLDHGLITLPETLPL